jgi:hypothetical protein
MKKNRIAFVTRIVFSLILTSCTASVTQTVQTPPPTAIPPQTTATMPIDSSSTALLPPQYTSPMQNANYVSKDATLAIRYGPVLDSQMVAGLQFTVKGDISGPHSGQTILADDKKTVIFKPDQPFTPGEQVQVAVNSLQSANGQAGYLPVSYSFNVALNQKPGGVGASTKPLTTQPQSEFPTYLTVPQDIPHYIVTVPSSNNAEGDIFVAPIPWTAAITGTYLLILDGQGQMIYYQSMANDYNAYDFKVVPNGMLSYFSQKDSTFYIMDSHYQVVNTYKAGDGYTTDLHDLLVLPNGNIILMAYDAETVDMSKVVTGGQTNATVTGLIIQEMDPSKNVIFEWRSWDHVAFTDTTSSLTDPNIDLVHGNGLALANDGNLLLSSRNLSEITKINLQTGDVMWRLGGKANQFTFMNDQPFAYQHNISQLPNGDITLFDNHGTQQNPSPSRGVEYKLDETNKTVTKVWEFTPTSPTFATFMGDTERLADGDTFLDWGAPFTQNRYQFVNMIEVDPQNQVVFQMVFDQPFVSYRAFRAPWHGSPVSTPTLAFKQDANGLTLGYSWNGATDVASWNIFGGNSPTTLTQIAQKAKDGFETQSDFIGLPQNECYFQAAAVDNNGAELNRSPVISTDSATCPIVP